MAIARQQTLKELVAPNVENQPLCINIGNNVNFELKSGFIHLLPTFNGLAGEDPHTHLKEFHMVWKSKTQFCCLEVQILATTEKSESVLQPRHYSVFSPYLEF